MLCKADDEQGKYDVGKAVVACQNVVVGTDNGEAPRGAGNRLIAHETGFSVDGDVHVSLLACRHFMSQRDDVSLLARIGTVEYGVGEQASGVGVDEVASVVAQHHEVGVGVGLLL